MKFFVKLRKTFEISFLSIFALFVLYGIFYQDIQNEIKIYNERGFWLYLFDNFIFYSNKFYSFIVHELKNDYIIQGLITVAVIVNIALFFHKKRYKFGFRVIKSLVVLVGVLVIYGGIFAILYFLIPLKYILIILSLFVIFVILVALKINKETNLDDRNDFLVEHVTHENGSEKSHFELTKPYAIMIALKAILFPASKNSIFSGGKGEYGGGGSSAKW